MKIHQTPESINQIIKGKILYHNHTQITGISTDTRTLKPGDIFFALKGDRFNGEDFIEEAFKQNAAAVVTENPKYIRNLLKKRPYFSKNKKSDDFGFSGTVITVKNTLTAYQNLAAFLLEIHPCKIIAITGSSGKTTVRQLLAAVLRTKYKTHENQHNENNLIGVPKTIFSMPDDTEILVCEAGMNQKGELKRLSEILKPDACVLTNVSSAHIGFFKNQNEIARAKSELLLSAKTKSDFFCLKESTFKPWFRHFKNIIKKNQLMMRPVPTSSIQLIPDGLGASYIKTHKTSEKVIDSDNKANALKTRFCGDHNEKNINLVKNISDDYRIDKTKFITAISKLKPLRFEVCTLGKYKYVFDAYNANPHSMKAGIDTFLKWFQNGSFKTLVLGDMFELGKFSKQYHLELAADLTTYLKNNSQKINLILIGKEMQYVYKVLKNEGISNTDFCVNSDNKLYCEEDSVTRNTQKERRILHYNTSFDASTQVKEAVKTSYVYMKASNGMNFKIFLKDI